MKKVLLIGSGAREHAIASALKSAKEEVELYVYASSVNPGLQELTKEYKIGDLKNNTSIVSLASDKQVDFAIIGPEQPLAQGIVDILSQINIPAVGPTKDLAQIETSKYFARQLLKEYKINGLPQFKIFESTEGIEEWILHLEENFVIKPDGLTGGKGVKVSGEHFQNMNEAMQIINDLLNNGDKVVIEEKFIGVEFSLMSFCDGEHLLHLPAVQDHKRALIGDKGLNTGGMGSYSMANFSLPFLDQDDIQTARHINEATATALKKKFNKGYKGILYGGFMATRDGVKLIEYNARFGDPEAMNVLSLFPERTFPPQQNSDFLEVCLGIVNGSLDKLKLELKPLATVCKYAVPEGYPEAPVKGQAIDLSAVDQKKVKLYYGSVDQQDNEMILGGSRAVAVVAAAKNIAEAEQLVETEIQKIKGPVVHRRDIGTLDLIEKRVEMMNKLRS